MKLNQLSDNAGARKSRMRVGRGIGSGKGKTAGRGVKGQKSRTGVAIKGFEGGQMPLHRRLPKRGFANIFRSRFRVVNLGRLQAAIDAGRLDPKQPITEQAIQEAGLVKTIRDGVRVLATGDFNAKISLQVTGASKSAVAAVEKAGGSVTVKIPPKEKAAPASRESGAGGTASESGDDAAN